MKKKLLIFYKKNFNQKKKKIQLKKILCFFSAKMKKCPFKNGIKSISSCGHTDLDADL